MGVAHYGVGSVSCAARDRGLRETLLLGAGTGRQVGRLLRVRQLPAQLRSFALLDLFIVEPLHSPSMHEAMKFCIRLIRAHLYK